MSEKRSILACFDHFFPSAKSGGPAKSSLGFAQVMSDKFHVTIATSSHDFGERENLAGVEVNKASSVQGFTVYYLTSSKRRSVIRKLIGDEPDFLYLNSFFSFSFSIFPHILQRITGSRSKLILAPRGELASSALAGGRLKKKVFIFLYKLLIESRKNVVYQASSEFEKQDIERVLPHRRIVVAPNLRPVSDLSRVVSQPIFKREGLLKVCLIARIHPIKNIMLAIDAVTDIPGSDIQFDIFGFEEDPKYSSLCREAAAKTHGRICLRGALPSGDVLRKIQEYHVFLLPTAGENFGHSILEAFIASRPVVISNTTPWRGLKERFAGFDVPLEKNSIVSAINDFVKMDQREFDRWCTGARKVAEKFYESQAKSNAYSQLFI